MPSLHTGVRIAMCVPMLVPKTFVIGTAARKVAAKDRTGCVGVSTEVVDASPPSGAKLMAHGWIPWVGDACASVAMNYYLPPEQPYGVQPEPSQSPRRPPRNGRCPAGPRPATYTRPG
jgi:hypothetical protein